MTRIVLDTNVIVSGFLRAGTPPGRLLNAVLNGLLLPVMDARIFLEYREVLSRPRFRLDRADVEAVLDFFRFTAEWVSPAPFITSLPDEDDRPFIETALAARVPLVTGNRKHFPPIEGLVVVGPSEALSLLELSSGRS
jgi:putative PIN family toxin of toxin-antitoxin system